MASHAPSAARPARTTPTRSIFKRSHEVVCGPRRLEDEVVRTVVQDRPSLRHRARRHGGFLRAPAQRPARHDSRPAPPLEASDDSRAPVEAYLKAPPRNARSARSADRADRAPAVRPEPRLPALEDHTGSDPERGRGRDRLRHVLVYG
jgi:hypothetical protein